MIVKPDSQGEVYPGYEEQARKTWKGYNSKNRTMAGATKLHISRDFSTSSNSLNACWTPVKSLGGRAWPSFQVNLNNAELCEKALVLWLNTTIGCIGRWWVSSRQQPGRSMMTVSTIPNIPTINLQELSEEQIEKMARLFDKYANIELLSAYLADRDDNRQAMDKELYIDILNLPESILEPLQIIRSQWCAEPSVRGSKK